MDSSEDDTPERPRYCHFCDSEAGSTLFVNPDNNVAICSDCVCKLMLRVYDLEALRALDIDTTKGH